MTDPDQIPCDIVSLFCLHNSWYKMIYGDCCLQSSRHEELTLMRFTEKYLALCSNETKKSPVNQLFSLK